MIVLRGATSQWNRSRGASRAIGPAEGSPEQMRGTASRCCPAGGSSSGTLARITCSRRTARDYERLTEHHEAIVYWAMIITMSRRLARHQQPAQPRAP